jgi:predicted transcriptional regulator
MGVLWDLGSATVAQVQERIPDDLAYTTVLTILRTLEDKGHVRHEEAGRAYRYFPTVDRESAGRSALRRLMRKVFKGSPEALLTQLVSERGLSPQQLERMRRLLDEQTERREEP